MSRETFMIEWNIARVALKGKIDLHPMTVRKWRADVDNFRLEQLNEFIPCDFEFWY